MFNFIKKNSSSGLATGVEKEEKERRKREKKERKEREKRERGAMGEDLLRIDDVRRSLKLRSRRSKEKEKLPSGITADYSANFFSADIDRAKLQDEIRGGTLAVRSDTLASDSSENSLSSVSTSTTAALGGPSASSGGRPPPLPPLPPRPPKRGILKGPKVASSVHSGGSGGEDTTDDSHLLLLNTLQNEHIAYSNLPLPHPSTSKTSSHASSSSSKFNISNHHSRNPAKYITRTFIANESGEVGPARNGFGNHRDSSHREVGGASSIESLTTEDSSSFLTPPFSTSPVGEGQGFHSRFRTAAHSSEDLTLEFPLPEIRTPSLPAPRELSIGRLSPNGDFGFSLRRGMIVARSGGSYVLQGVIFAEPGLHGNDTGLLPGDRLLEVNGVGVEEKTREEIIDMIRASESAVTVKVQPVAELSELTRRSGLDGIPVELDAESIRSGTLKRSGSLRFGSSRAKSEEQLASEKAWLAAEPLWLVHRAGFTRVRPLSPLSPPPGLSSRDGKVRVQVEGSGLELTVDEDDLEKCNPAQYDTCEDICSARHLNESSVLHTLRLRYASNLIHTNAGPTAIVLNPVAPLAIYSDKVAQLFKGCSSEDTPPHIFATAQALYRSLLGTRLDHALVPMGRSGAGKTTSMQHALRYLALTADSTSKILTPDKLNAIAIVLEAFGHARTCLNLNATRVSHIFSLDFDMTGAIASASIQLLLLDKQRVVRRSEGESNFHVFYRLLSGADSTLRKELMLDAITGGGEANQFITPYAKHEDKQRGLMDFVRLCAALTTLGTTEAELKAVFSLLAAVLHLGAAGAVKGSSGAAGKWQFQSPGAASRAAKVLGLAPDSLARALFSPQGPAAGGGSPGSPGGGGGTLGRRTAGSSPGGGGGRIEEASGQEMVESFAMNLYAEAFNSVGGLINRSLASSSHSVCSLLLVDTPGFQNPASTGLNQLGAGFSDLCFNYLQERLSLLFHHSSLVTPKDLYSQEHIDIPGLDLSDPDDEFSSPSALVSLLDNSPSPGPAYNSLGPAHSQDRKPPGLLWLLDELTSGGVGSASSPPPTFPDLVFGNFSEKEYHGLLRKAPGAHHFIVQHNLGTNPVLYNSEGWARQLREPSTPRALLALLSESTHKQLAALVGSSRGGGLSGGTYDLGAGGTVRGVTSLRRTATGGFAKRRSVPVQVKSAVDSLIETIRRTHLQFAHCLLPHHHAGLVDTRSLAPTAAPFDSLVNVPLLRSQLRGAQLLPAARLHKQGYPHHLPLAEFRRRYALLAAPPDSATDSSETPRADSATQPPPPPADDRGAVEEILLSLDLDASSYRVGLSQGSPMPGLLWVLIGIILLLLSFVLISSVIMPSLTILSTNSSLSIKRGDESERKCKSLNLLCIGDGDTCSQDDEIDKEHNKVELDRVESNRLGSDKVEQSNKLNKVTLSRVESNDVELYQAELRPPEVNTDVVDSGLLHVTEAATFEKETSSTENVNTLTTVDNNVDLCTDSIAIAMRKPSNSNIDFDVQCQSISDLNENVELKIARLETLPICSNDFNGIKVAKVIRTQNLFATNSLNEREVTQKNESHVHSPGNLLPEGTKRENTNLLQVNSSLGSSDLSDGDNLVPNFIIGDKLYNYDLSSHIEASVPLVASVRPDAMLETGSTDAEEEIPYMDVNELKRKKRRKRNKCMEIFNVPIEILNRIEEEAPRDDGLIKNETVSLANGHNTIGEKSLGLNKLERIEESSLGAEKSPRIEQDLLGCNKQSHDLGALKISEHVPRSELHSVDSNGQVLGGSNFKPDHSVGPNSRDLSFSWVFNHQLTSVQATSQSLDVYIVSSPVDELENTPSQTFDSFNKPVKRETCDLNKSSDNKQNILSNLNKTCEYNELNNLVTYKEEAEPEYKIKEDKPSHVFQKRNKMVDIKSKLKKVKVGKPIMVNDKITREKIERDDIKAVIIDRKIENDSSTTNNVDTLHFWGLAPIPESCFKSTHSLFSDSPVIDKCCSSESHENCSLISNLEVAERSNAEAPTHFTINESEMPSPSFTFNETFDFNLEPSESLPNAQFSPAYFSGNNQMMNPAHSLKSISDLDFLIGSIPGESKQTTHETYNPPPNSLSCSFSANNDLTNSDADSDVTISGNFEENALRSLDELCIKSLESIKSEPVSLSSMKSKRVTFLENDVSKENLLADSEYPIEKMVDSIVTDLDDEFDKESDTLVEDDVLSLSSSTSSLTSSSSESSGQSMIFNGVPASADSSANQEKPEEILKMDPAVLKHTSIAHALNQHSFHTYLSPIRELSLEISADESDFTNEEETEKEGKILPLKNKDCKTNSVERSLNTLDPELDECVTSFSTFENIVDSCEEDVCLLPRVEEVEMMSSETELDSEVNSSYPTKTITVELEPSEKSTYMCTHFESCHSSDCNSITPSSSDRKSDKMCRKMSSNFNNSEENSEIPIEPVVLNTKFHMAHLTNKANLTDDLSRVAKPNSTSESDELERCSDRPKTNSSGSDLSSELEHILSSIDYESSHSELSPRKYSPSNCSSQSNGSNKNGGGSNSSDNQSDYQDKRFSPSREQVCRMDSTGSDCSARSSGSTDGDSQDRFESRYTGQRGSSSKPGGNTLEKRKPPRSSYLPLKKYELVVVPQKVTLETLSDEKESSSRYRQMVIEKIKNFENINTAQPEPFQSPREIKVSKLREPIIKSNLFDKELNSTLIKDSHLFNSSNSIVNTRKENRTLKKIIQVPNVSDKVKCFEKRILERENSKSPSPEPVDSKNIFSEKISSFENLAKTSNTVSSLKNSPNIDVRVNVSEKLQSFENLKSKGGVSSKSPDFTVAKVEDTSKITSDKINTCNLKTPMKSIRSSYEEKLRNCQLFSSGSLKEHSKSPSKPQFDVLNRISNFESQIRTESETPKKSDGSATGLSKIPKMKTKSLECIFTSQQPKLAKPSERSVSVENISGKDSNVKAKTGSTTQFVNTSSRSLDHDPLSTRTVKNSPSPVSLPAGNLNSSSNKKGIVGQISNSKIPTEGLLNKGGHVNFSKPTQVKALKPQTNVITYPNIQTKPQISHSDSSTTNVEYGELPDIISRDKKDKQFLKDVLNDSGITEDFEDGLKINLSLNDVIVSQDRDVMEMMASIEAVERLSTASPQDRKHLDQKLKLDQPLGSDEPDMCHRTSNDDIFFRSHVLPQLEAERDKKLSSRVIAFQAQCRGYLARKHLAKLKVQDVAVRCIQRNVRKSLQVRDWSWWRLYLKIHPILNVHRTDQELKAKTEELEALKSKLEKLEVERNILKQDNTRLESKLGEITEDYADEHSTATLATERLHIESAERARLERELAEAQSANKRLAETSDKLEAEMQCLRSTDALSLEAEEESGGGSEGDVVYRKKWERAMRELELAKHRLSTQHQDDLEQMVGLRKQLEKKIADAHEQTEEQRQVAAEWKRKQTRLSSELADTRLLLEEQSSRNNLLEKKQRKFDAEFSLLQDELRQERNLKEKAMRDKELALGDKYTMEQSMSSLKLELELKDAKLAGLASELEELQFSSNTEEEVAALKKKKHALEARLKDQEEELDELAGQVQMLEQAKLKVEMSLEQMRKAHRKELSSKDEELEALRCSTQKKVKALQSQLESEHDSRSSLLRERHEMERRLSALADQGVATQAADAETMQRLKRDLKRTKALLKDTQTMLAQARQDNPNRLLLRQLRNQLEDAELARSVATKARLSLESDLADLTLSLEETSRAKGELEARLSEALRERSSLQSTLDENEEEMTEVLKKYQASVAQLSSEQAQLQEAATRVAELEADNAALKEQLADLSGRLESIEAHGDPSSTLALKRLMLKGKELESKLEFEHTTRSRLEVQISRLKETSDKLQAECNLLRGKDNSHSQEARRLQRSIRELKETVQGLEARGVNEALKRKELEKEVQCREAEIASLKNELSVSSQRIQDLQHAIQGDLDDEYDDEDDSDASSDQDQDISSDDEDYTSHQEDEVYTSKDTLRSCSDAGR